MFTKSESLEHIKALVESFSNNIDYIKKSGQYKEANVEDEYIKPLFRYLNWNISNEGVSSLSEREFIVQAKTKGNKEPDYLLQLDGHRKLYMEAKHPKYDLFKETKYVWQAYSYSYSTQSLTEKRKVDFAILTDFEEFRIFDCTFKVKIDTVQNLESLNFKFTEYITRFDELWNYFEKENIRNGSLDKLYLNEKKIKANRIEPDVAFLDDLDNENSGWRITLAKDLKKRNNHLDSKELTSIVQEVLDRLIFIKVLSDRDIEENYLSQLYDASKDAESKFEEGTINQIFGKIFANLNRTYNGAIFKSIKTFESINFGYKTLSNIIGDLLPNNSRYNFSVIPIEILGTIYERFLGKVIVTTDKRAKIELDEKESTKKAGGVFYTPQYIVKSILEWTIGNSIAQSKTIEDLFQIKICDPSCGSGSFLICAYDLLISRSKEILQKQFEKKTISTAFKKSAYISKTGEVVIRSKIKRQLLVNCIFGVDIDAQAVEVTKMSLCLKALEETNREELYEDVTLFNEKVLPNLENNIKVGNSLIGENYLDNELSLSIEQKHEIAVFSWQDEFTEVFASGGFDAVIGNPPYIRIQTTNANEINYYSKVYESAVKNYDMYCLFVEHGIQILKKSGKFGYILPHRFFKTEYGEGLRTFLSKHNLVNTIIDFDGYMVFDSASINTCLLLLQKQNNESLINYYKLNYHNEDEDCVMDSVSATIRGIECNSISKIRVKRDQLKNSPWIFIGDNELSIWNKLLASKKRLSDVSNEIFQGIKTGADTVFILEMENVKKGISTLKSKELGEIVEIESDLLHPLVKSSDMKRWAIVPPKRVVIFPYDSGALIPKKVMKSKYPLTWSYLEKCQVTLEARDRGKMKNENWYGYSRSQALINVSSKKILTPDYYESACFSYDDSGDYFFPGGGAGGYGIVVKKQYNTDVILAILNSQLADWYISKVSLRAYQTAFMYVKKYIESIPIQIDEIHEVKIVNLVESIRERKIKNIKNGIKSDNEILVLERKLNQIIFEMYSITEKEQKILVPNKRCS